ncbi:MAG TPA: DUF4870 domain-containing protein, partial [Anaerolineales bacterium]|nr:DUF4870 domain-containing protein [Anaerolineales bacterium]
LQAMGYQSLTLWAWFVGIFVIAFGSVFLFVLLEGLFAKNLSQDETLAPLIFQSILFLAILGVWGVFFFIGILGAVFCMIDRDFSYPFIGGWLKRKLYADQITEQEIEQWEDSWVSGICHSTAIIQFFGIITPLVIWFSQKGRSAKIRFQALQATIYQLAALIANILGSVAYVVVIFIAFIGMTAFGLSNPSASSSNQLPPAAVIFLFVFLGFITIFWLVIMIGLPIYYLLAAIASVSTIRGKDFKYPILGGIIAKRMNVQKKAMPPL